jgi:hypothetical protein
VAAASCPPTCAPRSPILQTTLGSCRSCCLSSGAGAGRRLRGSRFRPYQPTRSRSLPRSSPRGSFSTRSCSPTLSSCSSARLVSSDACATRASARTSPLAQLALRHGQLSVDARLLDDQRARCEDYDGCSRSSRRSFARVHVLSLARYPNSSTYRCCRRHIARRRHAGHPHRSPVYLLLSPQKACVRTPSTTRTARRTDRAIYKAPGPIAKVTQPANPRVLASRSQEFDASPRGGTRTRPRWWGMFDHS